MSAAVFGVGKSRAVKALTQFVAEIDVRGTHADLSVDGLLASHIDRLRSRGSAAATVQRYHALLGGAFQQAMKWGWAPRNVVRLGTPPTVPRRSRTVPTPEVVASLRAPGEMCGLRTAPGRVRDR